jgi:hypothetical protein
LDLLIEGFCARGLKGTMKPDREFADLIGRIYDCALDSSQWPEVLARITEALNGVMADLSVVDPLAGKGRVTAFHNWPQDVQELAMAHFSITPARGAILTLPLLEPVCTSRHLDIEAFHNSRYWKTCFAGRGYYDYLVTGLARKVTRLSGWGVVGAEARGAFEDADIELARLLSPHIQRALAISGVLDDRRVEAGTLRNALHALAAAALIVEPDGRIRFRQRGGTGRTRTRKPVPRGQGSTGWGNAGGFEIAGGRAGRGRPPAGTGCPARRSRWANGSRDLGDPGAGWRGAGEPDPHPAATARP